jgi:hypothetical protein
MCFNSRINLLATARNIRTEIDGFSAGGEKERPLVAFAMDITFPLQLHFLLYLHFNFLGMEKASSVSNCYFMGMNVEGLRVKFIFTFLMIAGF